MPAERLLRTRSPLALGQLVLAAAAVDPGASIQASGEALVVVDEAGVPVAALWPSVPDHRSAHLPWIAELHELSDDARGAALAEYLLAIGELPNEEVAS